MMMVFQKSDSGPGSVVSTGCTMEKTTIHENLPHRKFLDQNHQMMMSNLNRRLDQMRRKEKNLLD